MEPIVFERLAANEADHWWFVARRRILTDIIGRRIASGKNLRILEAGCGTGGNLGMLGQFGSVSAFEPDQAALAIASARGAGEVRKGHLPEGNPFPGPFDLIALLDVVEHLDQDLASLRALGATLAPEGRFLLTVPAYRFLWGRHDVMHHHKRRYARAELEALARNAGLDIEYCSHFNTLLFPALLARRMIGRWRPNAFADDDEMPGRLLNRILTSVFAAERCALGHVTLPFGASLLMIARSRRK